MDNIRSSQIISILDALSRVIEIDRASAVKRIHEYESMSDKEVIKDLSMFIYNNFKNDSELYDYFLNLIRNINPTLIPSTDYMKKELYKMFMNKKDSMTINDNHKIVCSSLKQIASLFNDEAIDYVAVGALPCYLACSVPLSRYHDDLNFMVNEDDLESVKTIMENAGYIFNDYRFPDLDEFHEMKTNTPPHQVIAQSPYNDFHIGFFTFVRNKDNSITTTEYLQRENNGEVIVDRLERNYSPLGTRLRFEDEFKYGGVLIKSCSIEEVYNLKGTLRRPKDIADMEVLEKFVDKSKLKELRQNTNTKEIKKNIPFEKGMTM